MPGHFPADLLLVLLFFGTLGVSAHLIFRLLQVRRLGKKKDRIDESIGSVLFHAFGGKKFFCESPGPGYLIIFWGLVFITLGTLESIARGVHERFSYRLLLESITLPLGWLYGPFSLAQDLFGLALLGAVCASLTRHLAAKHVRLEGDESLPYRDATVILVLVFLVVLFAFITGGLEMNRFAEVPRAWAPLSAMIAFVFSGTAMASQDIVRAVCWWLQVLAFMALLLYVPLSSLRRVRAAQETVSRDPEGRDAETDP